MSGEPIYLTLDEIVALQGVIVERTGSPPSPLLHSERRESALARPRQAAWYGGADLVGQAVSLSVGISQSQAFLDGNKRAAFAAAQVFLAINRLDFRGDGMAFARWLEVIAEADSPATRAAASERFKGWLTDQVVPRTD